MIQLIATDMDGTLLTPEKRLPPQLPALLEELYRRDITFAVSSGRSRMALVSLFGELAEEMIFICDNGACIIQPHQEAILRNLPQSVIHRVLTLCRSLPRTMPVLCGFHNIYYPEGADPDMEQEIRSFYRNFQILPYEALYQIEESILKIAICDMNHPETTSYPVIHAALGDDYEQPVSGEHWMDVMCKGVTKGAAVKLLQEQLGITEAETAVFGDYDNDISMMQHATYSYAMENAPERIRAQAKYIAPSNAENGVIRTICALLGIHYESLPTLPISST